MKHFLCAALTLVSLYALPAQASQLPAQCAELRVLYYERLEPQGLFGLATPKARATLVEDAVLGNLKALEAVESWKSQGAPMSWPKPGLFGAPPDAAKTASVAASYQQALLFSFDLAALCGAARKLGYKQLTFTCASDTRSVPGGAGQILSECFVSTLDDPEPSLSDLRKHVWGKPARVAEFTGTVDRYDAIANERYRGELYAPLLRDTINELVLLGGYRKLAGGSVQAPDKPKEADEAKAKTNVPAATPQPAALPTQATAGARSAPRRRGRRPARTACE